MRALSSRIYKAVSHGDCICICFWICIYVAAAHTYTAIVALVMQLSKMLNQLLKKSSFRFNAMRVGAYKGGGGREKETEPVRQQWRCSRSCVCTLYMHLYMYFYIGVVGKS